MKLKQFIKRLFKKEKKIQPIEPRIERDTECDKCKHLEQCKETNNVMDMTSLEDTRTHYSRSWGGFCIK